MTAMTDPETPDRAAHPRLDIADPYADDVDERIRAAAINSPTGAVRVYMLGAEGWDTDETADLISYNDEGQLVVLDQGLV